MYKPLHVGLGTDFHRMSFWHRYRDSVKINIVTSVFEKLQQTRDIFVLACLNWYNELLGWVNQRVGNAILG